MDHTAEFYRLDLRSQVTDLFNENLRFLTSSLRWSDRNYCRE
ncbi:hypothetical protein [Calothrix sp. FACHB-168]|nr:hypothetical protein [Calothrix sp. FACHB-168]